MIYISTMIVWIYLYYYFADLYFILVVVLICIIVWNQIFIVHKFIGLLAYYHVV